MCVCTHATTHTSPEQCSFKATFLSNSEFHGEFRSKVCIITLYMHTDTDHVCHSSIKAKMGCCEYANMYIPKESTEPPFSAMVKASSKVFGSVRMSHRIYIHMRMKASGAFSGVGGILINNFETSPNKSSRNHEVQSDTCCRIHVCIDPDISIALRHIARLLVLAQPPISDLKVHKPADAARREVGTLRSCVGRVCPRLPLLLRHSLLIYFPKYRCACKDS